MLFSRTFAALRRIGNERLQLPIFYESPLSLRFEIGDGTLSTNHPHYFRSALWRASFLFEKAPVFDTLLWVLYRTPDTDTDVDALLSAFCRLARLPGPAEVYTQATTDSDGEPLTRIFSFWDMQQTPPNAAALLDGIIHTDFHGFSELSSAVFFLQTGEHPFLLHLYDDRGMDLVSDTTDALLPFYQDCSNWLLDYDRPRMDAMFSSHTPPSAVPKPPAD